MEATVAIILRAIFVLSVFIAPVLAQAPGSQQQQPEFIKQGQQLMREGKLDAALALYRQTLQTSQDSLPANMAAGSVLPLDTTYCINSSHALNSTAECLHSTDTI